MKDSERRQRQFLLDRFLNGFKAAHTLEALSKEFEGKTYSSTTVHDWFKKFRSGDLSIENKPKPGRPFTIDYDDLEKDVITNPKQSPLDLARKYQCSQTLINRVMKGRNFVRVEKLWVKSFIEEEQTELLKPVIKTHVVERELSLEQKIYIVSRYYESGRVYDKIIEEFDEKFNVKTADNLLDFLKTVVEMFEATGSVKEKEVYYNTIEEIDIKEEPQNDFETIIVPEIGMVKEESNSSLDIHPSSSSKMKKIPKKVVKSKTIKSNYPRECPVCKKMVSPYTYHNHVKRHSDLRPHICDICNKSFKLRIYLVSHLETHKPDSERKAWVCQICGVKSYVKSNHNKHMKTSHPESFIIKDSNDEIKN